MRWYLADVLEHLFITACAVLGHFRGCWLINSSPIRHAYWWAVNVRWDDQTAQHTACPLCYFDRTQYDNTLSAQRRVMQESKETTWTSLGGTTSTFKWDVPS